MSGDRPCPPNPYRTADGWHIIPPRDPADLLTLIDELEAERVPHPRLGRRRELGRA